MIKNGKNVMKYQKMDYVYQTKLQERLIKHIFAN